MFSYTEIGLSEALLRVSLRLSNTSHSMGLFKKIDYSLGTGAPTLAFGVIVKSSISGRGPVRIMSSTYTSSIIM